ncbi:MAG: 3'-5' exonuclease, partial [Anaerovoracaceae bacterium]
RSDDEKEEARYSAQEIDRLKTLDRQYKDFAILYRTNAQSRNFEEALSARGIPYRVVGGTRYYERKEIKDIVAYMRLVQNPEDDLSFLRVINEPKRGIGATTQQKLEALARVNDESIFSTLMDEDIRGSLSAKAGKAIGDLMMTLAHFHEEKENLRVSDIYDGLLAGTGYMKALEDMNTIEAEGRLENLLEFKSVIYDEEAAGELSLGDFLERIALLSDVDNHDADENAVVLMTMHSAKGLEFPFVFLPGMEDGLFPGWRALENDGLEEERRLCYVGMTRAKERLCLTGAAYRTLFGKGNYTRESIFLRELDPKLMDGDGVYVKKEEVRLGEHKPLDGYSSGQPFVPFDGFRAAKKEIQQKAKNTETFAAGDRVSHGKFGEGMVVEVSGNVVSVVFDSAGVKKLAADIAPIKKI